MNAVFFLGCGGFADAASAGDELTTGRIVDTNANWLCDKLFELGVDTAAVLTVGDYPDRLEWAWRQAMSRADLVISTKNWKTLDGGNEIKRWLAYNPRYSLDGHQRPQRLNGRYAPFLPYFWAVWNFSKSKPAAKSLLTHLSQPAAVEKLVAASGGYDLPSFEKLTTLKTWAEEGPPKGTLYHYPNPHNHQTLSIAAAPAPHKIAEQIYTQGIQTQMAVRYFKGEAMDKTLDWAAKEIEGFMRN